jgi:hypothetical protein
MERWQTVSCVPCCLKRGAINIPAPSVATCKSALREVWLSWTLHNHSEEMPLQLQGPVPLCYCWHQNTCFMRPYSGHHHSRQFAPALEDSTPVKTRRQTSASLDDPAYPVAILTHDGGRGGVSLQWLQKACDLCNARLVIGPYVRPMIASYIRLVIGGARSCTYGGCNW